MSKIVKGRFREGYYKMFSPTEKESVLVDYYFCDDKQCWGFGFNIRNGGGFLPEWDIEAGVILTLVKVVTNHPDYECVTP